MLRKCLENGVLLCQHANHVNNAARKAYSLNLAPPLKSILENCKYHSDARPQTFNARGNISQFVKWACRVVGVCEILMLNLMISFYEKIKKKFYSVYLKLLVVLHNSILVY
jgi:hypothetical protein